MGFSIGAGEYGRFIPQRSPLAGLLFAGQWVFPGFGIAGAAASGYYATKALMADEGYDLDARLRSLEA
jgi:phytoene dehydrogenase-like protein